MEALQHLVALVALTFKRVTELLEPKNIDNFSLKATQYVDNHLRFKKQTKDMADARRKKNAQKYQNGGGKDVPQFAGA